MLVLGNFNFIDLKLPSEVSLSRGASWDIAKSSLKENPVSTKISGAWLTLAEAMGAVSTKVILTIIFFVFLVPVAWLYRLFEKELTHHFFQKKSDSYFMDKKQNYSKDIFEKTW